RHKNEVAKSEVTRRSQRPLQPPGAGRQQVVPAHSGRAGRHARPHTDRAYRHAVGDPGDRRPAGAGNMAGDLRVRASQSGAPEVGRFASAGRGSAGIAPPQYAMSVSSLHPNAYPSARFTSGQRCSGNLEIRLDKDSLDTVLRLSQFATQGSPSPSRRPSGTSTGISRIVVVISATTNLFRYEHASSRVNRSTGRRPAGFGKF